MNRRPPGPGGAGGPGGGDGSLAQAEPGGAGRLVWEVSPRANSTHRPRKARKMAQFIQRRFWMVDSCRPSWVARLCLVALHGCSRPSPGLPGPPGSGPDAQRAPRTLPGGPSSLADHPRDWNIHTFAPCKSLLFHCMEGFWGLGCKVQTKCWKHAVVWC